MIVNSSLVLQGQLASLIIIAHRYYQEDIVGTNPPSKTNIAPQTWQDWPESGCMTLDPITAQKRHEQAARLT